MIEIAASKSCIDGALSPSKRADFIARPETPTERRRSNAFVWLNLVCLDAPIVAISWMFLFMRSFRIAIAPGGTAALFLTAWFIYLADRFVDNLSLDQHAPRSLRQRFCRQHRISWLLTLFLIGVADVFLVFARLDPQTRAIGAAVSAGAFAYVCVNQFVPFVWRRLPLKEICIGFLFAAGTVVPLTHGLTRAMVPTLFLFACLCSLNCISIAIWERELDIAQDRVSIATTFPRVSRLLLPAAGILCLTSYVFGARELVVSGALLVAIHIFRNKLQPDLRTALADLVLLTPVATLIMQTLD